MTSIEIELTDDEFNYVARQAHKLDITFNKMIERIICQHMGIEPQEEPQDNAVEIAREFCNILDEFFRNRRTQFNPNQHLGPESLRVYKQLVR